MAAQRPPARRLLGLHSRAVPSQLQVSSRPSPSSRRPNDVLMAAQDRRSAPLGAPQPRGAVLQVSSRPSDSSRPISACPHGRAATACSAPSETAARRRPSSRSAAARPTARDRPRRRPHGRAAACSAPSTAARWRPAPGQQPPVRRRWTGRSPRAVAVAAHGGEQAVPSTSAAARPTARERHAPHGRAAPPARRLRRSTAARFRPTLHVSSRPSDSVPPNGSPHGRAGPPGPRAFGAPQPRGAVVLQVSSRPSARASVRPRRALMDRAAPPAVLALSVSTAARRRRGSRSAVARPSSVPPRALTPVAHGPRGARPPGLLALGAPQPRGAAIVGGRSRSAAARLRARERLRLPRRRVGSWRAQLPPLDASQSRRSTAARWSSAAPGQQPPVLELKTARLGRALMAAQRFLRQRDHDRRHRALGSARG